MLMCSAIFIFTIFIVIYELLFTDIPEGYQDSTGFHYGKEPNKTTNEN